ncbi:phage portal protein [Nesterenkonia halotolerans]|uniref:phage portal protein n=1 Tax=Nesterenkonia halotolerans TaxID=225325 RepID=UPI003EE6A6D3
MGFMEWFTGRQSGADQPAPRHAPSSARPVLPRSESTPVGVTPPSREQATAPVTVARALGLTSCYRAFDILTTAALQVSVDAYRAGKQLDDEQTPALIRRPDLETDRETFIEYTVLSLVTDGNAYWHKQRGPDGSVIAVKPLHPHEVWPTQDPKTLRVEYHYRGKKIAARDMQHLHKIKLPGQLKGLGPIQAARIGLSGALDTRDYAAQVFDGSGQPTGVVSTEQPLNGEEAQQARNRWNGLDDEGEPIPQVKNPSGVKVLGKGMSYKPILLNPRDAQWIEAQQFGVTEVARLLGMPASLLLAAVEGSSQTYSNVEQDWLALSRFTLMGYFRKIELALTDLIPRGQTARFNLEALLRPDATTRYALHKSALDAEWMVDDEVREIEKLPPLTDEQRAQIAARPKTPAPAGGTAA